MFLSTFQSGMWRRLGNRAYVVLSLLLLAVATPSLAATTNVTKYCNPSSPTSNNCLTSCKRCTSATCLYQCHYDTVYQVLSLAITPSDGASIPAFQERVLKLSLFLEEDVTLRIDPAGVYSGRMMVADYIATFVHPLGSGSQVSIAGIQVTHFANTGDVAASTINLQYYMLADPTRRISNLTVVMFSRFNSTTQKLSEGDWNFLRFPQFQMELSNGPRVSDATSAAIVAGVCQIDAKVCQPLGFGGYDNLTDCVAFMSSIPRIADYGLQGNNQYCRFLHMAYATVDPKVHCPHISKSGGGVCVEQTYTDYYKVFPANEFVGGAKKPKSRRALV